MKLNLTQYPLMETYANTNLSKSDIQSDLVMTIYRRYYMMDDNQRAELGLTDKMMTNTNLYRMINEGRIQTTFWKKINGLPSYTISMDLDGDGLFSSIPNMSNVNMGYIPEKPAHSYNKQTYDRAKKELMGRKWKEHLMDDPNPSEVKQAWWWLRDQIEFLGIEAVREIDADMNEGFRKKHPIWSKLIANTLGKSTLSSPFHLLFAGDEGKMLSKEVQKNQQELLLLQSAMAQRGDVEEYNVLKGNIVMGKDGKVIRSENAFFDLIAKNEGFEGTIYDAKNPNWKPSDGFDTASDPTIGHGFSLKNSDNIQYLINAGYNWDDIKSGKGFLKMEDSIDIFLDNVLPKYQKEVQELYPNIDFTNVQNSFLYLALTDMNYHAGSRLSKRNVSYEEDGRTKQKTVMRSGFIGTSTQFYKHLNNYVKTNDTSYIGKWEEANPETVLGQMRIDANVYKNKGLTGIYHRLENNAKYITNYMNGISTPLSGITEK